MIEAPPQLCFTASHLTKELKLKVLVDTRRAYLSAGLRSRRVRNFSQLSESDGSQRWMIEAPDFSSPCTSHQSHPSQIVI